MDLGTPLHLECTVSGALGFILFISRIFGIAPLKFESVRDGWRIRVSRVYSFYGQGLVIVFTTFAFIALVGDLTDDTGTAFRTNTNANRFVWISDVFTVSMVVLTASLTGTSRMRRTINCLAQLRQISNELNCYYPTPKPNNTKKWLIVIVILILGISTIFIDFSIFIKEVIDLKGKVLTSSYFVFYNIMCVTLELAVIQFTLTALTVLPTLELLNSCLKSLLQKIYSETSTLLLAASYPQPLFVKRESQKNAYNQLTRKPVRNVFDSIPGDFNGGPNTTSAALQRLTTVYCLLSDIVRQLDESNGTMLVLLLLSLLLHLIITPYHLITGLFHAEKSDHSSSLLQLAWAIYHFSKLIMIVEPCHLTHEQLDTTRSLVNKMKRYAPPDDFAVVSELRRFHRHLTLNQVTYSPMQFFTLNRSLIAAKFIKIVRVRVVTELEYFMSLLQFIPSVSLKSTKGVNSADNITAREGTLEILGSITTYLVVVTQL